MIVPMRKLYVAVRASQKDRLLGTLGQLGVVHLKPVDPAAAHPDEKVVGAIGRLKRAEQVLANIEPAGQAPAGAPLAVADRALELVARAADLQARLTALYREAEQLAPWGDTRLEWIQTLRGAGVHVRVFVVAPEEAAAIPGDCVAAVSQLGRNVLVAVASRDAAAPGTLPKSAKLLPIPPRDRPGVLAEAKRIDAERHAGGEELKRLTGRLAELRAEQAHLEERARYTAADRSGLAGEALFGVQGWVPAEQADGLAAGIAAAGLDIGVQFIEPQADEVPPTLVRYPRWASPIQGLFDILGTVPGYREYDLSGFFMIALPIFCAMLIGDAGYALLILLTVGLLYRRMTAKVGKPLTNLVIVFGVTTLIWGVMTATYFGLSPDRIAQIGGFVKTVDGMTAADVPAMRAAPGGWAAAGRAMLAPALLYREDGEQARNLVIMISFILGGAHLITAQIRQAVGVAPNIRALANVGWATFLLGMLGVVWSLFFKDQIWMPQPVMIGLLIAGGSLIVLFTAPSLNPLKIFGAGLMANILPMIGTFSDTMSYIRLMAVGMAGFYIADSFNQLAAQVAGGSSWLLAWPILLIGHGLNLALAAIAVFAHGVRLNMLEFSNNAGVQWSGYAYAPFTASNR